MSTGGIKINLNNLRIEKMSEIHKKRKGTLGLV
jgi:hypothetical protein